MCFFVLLPVLECVCASVLVCVRILSDSLWKRDELPVKVEGVSMALRGRFRPLARLAAQLYYRREGKNEGGNSQTSW